MAQKFPKSDKLNFKRNLVKRHKLVTHLDNYLANEPKGFTFNYEGKEQDDAWHPSGDITPLVTDLYKKATTPPVERSIPVALQKTFLVGHFWHQLLQWAVVELEFAEPICIEARGTTVWGGTEEAPKPYHWSTGQADVAPCSIPVHGDYLIDFKTMKAADFKQSDMPYWAGNKYEAQINVYMDWFDLEKALIVCINKDSPHDMKEFEFHRNQPLIDATYEKWKFVSELADASTPPSDLDDDEFDLSHLIKGPVAQ